jgi:F-type H+-transporting ATPase subunit delta
MTSRAAAARYARALFDVVRDDDPERAGTDLSAFVALVESHPDLKRALVNPAVPLAAKQKIVAELLQLRPLTDPVARLLRLLAERDRLVLLPEVAEVYQQRLLDHLQVLRAEVTTAVPLTPERAAAIERSLAQATGKRVLVSTQVDPAIMGGIVARIGSLVYDGSVAHQLERLRAQLIEAAQ